MKIVFGKEPSFLYKKIHDKWKELGAIAVADIIARNRGKNAFDPNLPVGPYKFTDGLSEFQYHG